MTDFIQMMCSCEKYKKSAKQIFGAQVFASTHGMQYTGDIWQYCPWCGQKLNAIGVDHDANH